MRRLRQLEVNLWGVLIILCIVGYANADILCNNKQSIQQCGKNELDIVTKKETTDLLGRPQKQPDSSVRTRQTHTNNYAINDPTNISESISTPTLNNVLKVYIGPCVYSVKAVKNANSFLEKHKEFIGQFFMTATREKYEFTKDDIGGIEFYLPLDAEKYNITSVPSMILIVNSKEYKISGLVDIEEIYNEIKSGKIQGQDKGQYIEVETKGKGCQSAHVNLTPVKIPKSEIEKFEKENKPPDLSGLLDNYRFSLPSTGSPKNIDYKIQDAQYLPFSRYIVFSQTHKKWAQELIKQGAMGCCVDCEKLDEMFPYVQMCSKELLDEMSVKSVPTVVNIRAK